MLVDLSQFTKRLGLVSGEFFIPEFPNVDPQLLPVEITYLEDLEACENRVRMVSISLARNHSHKFLL